MAVQQSVPLPAGYAVPSSLESLIEVLYRHGFTSTRCRNGEFCRVESLRVKPIHRPRRQVRKVVLDVSRMRRNLDRYEVFPTQQRGGDALAVFLEPESKHGLHRFHEMQISLLAASWYPVLRVFDTPYPRDFNHAAPR